MTVRGLIEELNKLPRDLEITFQDYYNEYEAQVCWDISEEQFKNGYSDEPYIYLTKIGEK